MFAPSIIAWAKVQSFPSIAKTAAFKASQISFLPEQNWSANIRKFLFDF